jgi:hypothetical protein
MSVLDHLPEEEATTKEKIISYLIGVLVAGVFVFACWQLEKPIEYCSRDYCVNY